MNLTISGHHLDVSPALRAYVMSKLERVLRHFNQIIEVKVVLSVDNQSEKDQRQQAMCSLRVKGNDLHVGSRHSNLYAAVDCLADKLDRRVVSHKSRLKGWRSLPLKRAELTTSLI